MSECDELHSEARNICLIANNVSEAVDQEYQSVVSQVPIETGPFAGQKTNRIKLGPFIKPEFVKELIPSLGGYPDTPSLPPFIYSPYELHCPWTKANTKPLAGWTACHDTLDWFNRLSSRHEKWKSQRIYEFLKLSTYPSFPFDGVLSASLLSCWNPCLNVFITGQGPMTVTLEDIAYITGLSPSGIDLPYHAPVEGALDVAKILFRRVDNKVVPNLSFSYFMSRYKGGGDKEVTREEEVFFINLSLCKMLMGPSINVYRTFLLLAANIEASPADKPLALAPFLLAQFYRCMYKLRTSTSLVHAGGPLWLLTFWGFLYFPSFVSIKSPEEMNEAITNDMCISPSSACCYGEVATLLTYVPSGKTPEEILSKLLDSKPPSGSNKVVHWHPCSAKDEMDGPLDCFSSWAKFAVPLWLRETSPIMYKSEDSAHWQSILAQRDLLYVGPQTIGVEVYNPNLVARQFGMIQACAIPFYQTQNRPWGSRLEFLVGGCKKGYHEKYDIEKALTSSHALKIAKFNVQPWFCSADVDDGFCVWWKDFWKRHKKAKTFITNQQVLIKSFDEYHIQIKTDTLDKSPSYTGTRRETETANSPPSPMATRTNNIQDSIHFSFRSPRTKKRVSASAGQIVNLKVDPQTETVNEKAVQEDEDDTILLCRLKRRKSKGVNSPTPMSPGSSTDHASNAPPPMDMPPSSNGTVCVVALRADNTRKRGKNPKSGENIEANEDPPELPVVVVSNVESPIQRAYPISRSSIDNTLLNGPNNITLNEVTPEPHNQHTNENLSIISQSEHEDVDAPDSVKAYGKLSARIEHLLRALSPSPSPGISLLELKKASLLDTLEQLVKDPSNFDSFTTLMGLAQEFTELAPASFQSTMDHLKKSIGSIQELSFKLKNQGPQILSSLMKKPELTASMERLRVEVEKKVEGVHTLRKTHVNICKRIEILEAELMLLKRQRDVVGEQLVDADNELASLSHQLDDSVTALENEADRLARAESMRTSWDQDMKVFKSAIVGIIEQLRSL